MADKTTLKSTLDGSDVGQLCALRDILAEAIDDCESKRDLAALTLRFADVVERIRDVRSSEPSGVSAADEIAARRAKRRANG